MHTRVILFRLILKTFLDNFVSFLQGEDKINLARYHEVGRAVATIFADEVFHDVAYKARKREHLLAGIDEFLDAVTVLPPGEWDPSIR